MRRARRVLREKFSSSNENPHGFGYVAPYRAGPCTRIPYRLTVTLNVPTFPLVSNERSEIVCSPGANWPKSTE